MTINSFETHEHEVNTKCGIRDTRGSGALHGDGDGKGAVKGVDTYDQIIVECKYTEKNKRTIPIKKDHLDKLNKAAIRFGRMPVLSLADIEGTAYMVMDLNRFAKIYKNHIEYVKEHGDES